MHIRVRISRSTTSKALFRCVRGETMLETRHTDLDGLFAF